MKNSAKAITLTLLAVVSAEALHPRREEVGHTHEEQRGLEDIAGDNYLSNGSGALTDDIKRTDSIDLSL